MTLIPVSTYSLLFTSIIVIDRDTNAKLANAKIVVTDAKTKKNVLTTSTLKNGMVSLPIAVFKKDGVSDEIIVEASYPEFRTKKITIKTYKPSTFTIDIRPLRKKKPQENITTDNTVLTDNTVSTDNTVMTQDLGTERLPFEDNTGVVGNRVSINTNQNRSGNEKDGKKNKKMILYFGLGAVALCLSVFLIIKATKSSKPQIIDTNV